MKRIMMQVYVRGSAEAIETYQRAFGATLGDHARYPDGTFYHSELAVGGAVLAVAELPKNDTGMTGDIMQFCLHFNPTEEAELRKAYDVLVEGANILSPLGPVDFSPCMADLIDRFGVRWCLFL